MSVWVISGCSSGLGRCWTDSVINERKGRVVGLTRSQDAADEMRELYQDAFVPCVVDVQDEWLVAEKMKKALSSIGERPNRVVPAAGYAQFGTIEDLTNRQIREQFSTNVEGALNVVRPLLPMLRSVDDARILFVSSMSGVASWPLLGAYQISKYAIEAVSDTLRQELEGTGIQVGCIEPGPHKTGWATTYARRHPIGENYNQSELISRASCGYPVLDPIASLPFFWKMFDSPEMPRRIATSREFVEFAIKNAEEKINDWRSGHDY